MWDHNCLGIEPARCAVEAQSLRIELKSPALQGEFLTTELPGKSQDAGSLAVARELLWHVGSSSLARDWTWAPSTGSSEVWATELPGKSLTVFIPFDRCHQETAPTLALLLTGVKQKHASVLVPGGGGTEGRSNAQPSVLRTRFTLLPTPHLGQHQTPRLRSLVNETASQSLWYQPQVQVVLCASDRLAVNQRCPQPLLRINYFARVAHRTQRNMLLPRLLVHYKGYESIWINSWMNRWTRRGPEHRSFWVGDLAIWKLSEPHPFGFLWRFHHICRMEEITGRWWWIQTLASPYPGGWCGG